MRSSKNLTNGPTYIEISFKSRSQGDKELEKPTFDGLLNLLHGTICGFMYMSHFLLQTFVKLKKLLTRRQ
jgi:hypothetical protein